MTVRPIIAAAAILLAACDPMPETTTPTVQGPVPDTGITLSESACFGTCPVYSMTVYPNEFYQLDAGRFTRTPGMTTGTLPAGSWVAANAALQTASFGTLPLDITRGSPACGNTIVSDLPGATITETTIAGPRTVEWYPGCFTAPDRARLDQLVTDLRSALSVDSIVAP